MRLQRQRKAHGREGGDAPQAKGTKTRQSQGRTPPFQGRGGRSMYIKSFSQPASPGGRRGQDGAAGVRTGESRAGGASWDASCQFRTKRIMYIPTSSSQRRFSSPKTSFCSFAPKKVFLDTFSSLYSLLQTARPVSRHYHELGEEGSGQP